MCFCSPQRQISTEDRTILGKISKRGNRYLRVLFVWVTATRSWFCLVGIMREMSGNPENDLPLGCILTEQRVDFMPQAPGGSGD
jgi:hypothetical protein